MARNPWPCALSRPISNRVGSSARPTSRPATRRNSATARCTTSTGSSSTPFTPPKGRSSVSPRNASRSKPTRARCWCSTRRRRTNDRTGGGFTRMMERLAKMVGAPAPVQLLEVQRYYAIDLSSARVAEAPLDTSELGVHRASLTAADPPRCVSIELSHPVRRMAVRCRTRPSQSRSRSTNADPDPPSCRPRHGRSQPRSARRGRAPRRSAARRRRCRIRQDEGAHAPHRPPDPRGHAPVPDPRHHVHQQGRRRDARAGRAPRRSGRQDDVGVDVPLGVRPHPARRRRPARIPAPVLHLRPGRLGAAHRLRDPRPRSRRQALHAAGRPRVDLAEEERTRLPGRGGRQRGEHLRPQARRRVPRVPVAPREGRRDGLRRPAHQRRAPVPRAPRRARALSRAVRAHPRRRVPGHQPGPERDRPAPRRRPPERLRGGRHRSIGVPISRG